MAEGFEVGYSNERGVGHDLGLTLVGFVESRDGEYFGVERGYTDELVARLVEKSRQERIVQHCPRDSAERFASPQAFEKWRTKEHGRSPYFLTDNEGDLAGIAWFGCSQLDEEVVPDFPPNHKFAVRIYDGYDGRGLAKGFIRAATEDYLQQLAGESRSDDFNGFHLQADAGNLGARRLYESIGYVGVDANEDSERITMILLPSAAYRFIGAAPVE
jgi:hypothetical protein